jgi:hypothetical protein
LFQGFAPTRRSHAGGIAKLRLTCEGSEKPPAVDEAIREPLRLVADDAFL